MKSLEHHQCIRNIETWNCGLEMRTSFLADTVCKPLHYTKKILDQLQTEFVKSHGTLVTCCIGVLERDRSTWYAGVRKRGTWFMRPGEGMGAGYMPHDGRRVHGILYHSRGWGCMVYKDRVGENMRNGGRRKEYMLV